jgi:hypothetical protein
VAFDGTGQNTRANLVMGTWRAGRAVPLTPASLARNLNSTP